MKQRVKVALSGYLVTITFGAIFVVTRIITPDQPQTVALGAAIVMALPLAVAFIGDKIKSFKGFGIEVETKAAAERITEITLPSQQTASAGYDIADVGHSSAAAVGSSTGSANDSRADAGGIPGQVCRLIASPNTRLVEVDLHDGTYWWPARLFLLAALLDEFTNVQRLVFGQAVNGKAKYAGMAEPVAVTRRIELALPGVTAAYRSARQRAESRSAAPIERVVEQTSSYWTETVSSSGIDEAAPPRVDRAWLVNTLGDDWRWAAVDADSERAGQPTAPVPGGDVAGGLHRCAHRWPARARRRQVSPCNVHRDGISQGTPQFVIATAKMAAHLSGQPSRGTLLVVGVEDPECDACTNAGQELRGQEHPQHRHREQAHRSTAQHHCRIEGRT